MTTVKHWMVLFVGLMLEIYHCWLPLQERIPPICPWGWSDTSRVSLFLGLSILYPRRVSNLDRSTCIFKSGPSWTDCLYAEPWGWSYEDRLSFEDLREWSFMDRLSVCWATGWSYEDRPSIKGSLWVVWYRETFCLLSHSSGSITMWYKISCLLIQALFLSCV